MIMGKTLPFRFLQFIPLKNVVGGNLWFPAARSPAISQGRLTGSCSRGQRVGQVGLLTPTRAAPLSYLLQLGFNIRFDLKKIVCFLLSLLLGFLKTHFVIS